MKKKTCYNKNMHKRISRQGFTLVELSLSLVFIAILSIAVVLVMTGAISSYHRSLTLNKINNVGAGLVRDMQDSIKMASADSLKTLCSENYVDSESQKSKCDADGGKNFASVTRFATVKVKNGNINVGSVPVYGAVCTGYYSYIWNSGYFFNDSYEISDGIEAAKLFYKTSVDGDSISVSGFKLLKIKDEERKVCVAAIKVENGEQKNYYEVQRPGENKTRKIQPNFNMAALTIVSEEPVWYLGSNEKDEDGNLKDEKNNLAIYDMNTSVSEQVGITKNAYYYSSFVLGTVQGGVNINVAGNTCATPGGNYKTVENLDYCAINKFNFAALASGG